MEEEEWKQVMREHQEKIMRRATGTVPEQKEARLYREEDEGTGGGLFQIYRSRNRCDK
jgi:hypothetical protein